MFDDVMDTNDTGLLELTVRLESYAAAHLTPSPLGAGRTRANVMNAAHRRATLMAAGVMVDDAHEGVESLAIARRRPLHGAWRRAGAALVAASLALAMVAGTVYGAKAGGPLYATRLWIETSNLPGGVLPRAHAEVDRLDTRVREAQQASAEGDAPGVEAALAAYSAIVSEAALGAAGDPTAIAAIEFSLNGHLGVLTQLAEAVPTPARLSVLQALTSNSRVLDDLESPARPQGNGARPGDVHASGATGPNAPRPARPGQGKGAVPPATGEDKGQPTKTPSPPKGSARDLDSPPPGQSRGGGPSPTHRADPPSADPSVPAVKPAGPAKDGGT
jgi:hypothetical protein